MNINLHIERLVLDGLPLEHAHGPLLLAAVEAELTRLLNADGLTGDLTSGGSVARLSAPGVEASSGSDPARLGREIANSVYGSINQPR